MVEVTVIALFLTMIFDWILIYKKGYPSLTLLIVKCYYSKNFKWLTYNLWGDDSNYYKKVREQLKAT